MYLGDHTIKVLKIHLGKELLLCNQVMYACFMQCGQRDNTV